MNLIAALLLAFPLGRFVPDRRVAYGVITAVWLAILPFQTASVRAEGNYDWSYWLVNGLILVLLDWALVTLGAHLRTRRLARQAAGGA